MTLVRVAGLHGVGCVGVVVQAHPTQLEWPALLMFKPRAVQT